MSDADSFIQEVSEEVRRDRLFGLWKRYAPLVIGVIVAVVAAAAFIAWRDAQDEAAAREAGAALIDAGEEPTAPARAERYLTEADALPEGAALLARLRAAGELAAAGEVAEARGLYDAVAIDTATPPSLAAFAAYRAAMLTAAGGDAAGAVAQLSPLAGAEGSFRLLALEARGALRLGLGDLAGAREDVEAVLADPAATEETRGRAGLLASAIRARDPQEAAQ
ncbi:tetratricopeptide repeat protein [Rubrimonas cliftonensis]|uniref:Ancillary SecYEG translocon subunit/Cell division coordinator CpoB TPR domain-containing protein n=1 Tax=Rubrimonas cliftonensis TaxID=89524 RepID=A0A1H3ZEL9_9RHOB|nr:tetratricopeptide repeat protein [Rubrimonas cliftonensis]SEA22186.1 hypothetical protein SAMN05444370_103511 [Rubrimonas cliftonensis]